MAESIAKTLIQPGERGEPTGVKRHQFRRIFDEVKRHLRTVEGSPERWDEVLPLIKMVKSKTAYAVARAKTQSRRDAAYYENLYQFVSRGIDQVSTLAEYRSLCLLMEAVYGFYYQLGGAQTD